MPAVRTSGGAQDWHHLVPLIATAAAVSLAVAPGIDGLFGATLALIAFAIAAVDRRRQVIPDRLSVALAATGGLRLACQAADGTALAALAEGLTKAAVCSGILLAVRFSYRFVRKRDGLGLGDVKLAGAGAIWLEWHLLPLVLELAALSALVVCLAGPRLASRAVAWDRRVPFGLFLAPSLWIGWLVGAVWG